MTHPDASIAELWRYPVKGMRGESASTQEVDATGIAFDRRYAFESTGAPRGKPLLTGKERAAMLLYQAAAENGAVRIAAPTGERFAVDDPALLRHLQANLPGGCMFQLLQAERPLTDVRPIALLGVGSVLQLAEQFGQPVDPRRFRANLLLSTDEPFAEERFAGRNVQIGEQVVVRVLERIPRCRIVTLDPETTASDPALMKHLDRYHGGCIGVYASVVRPGVVHTGDPIRVV